MSGEGLIMGARWPRKPAVSLTTPDPRFDPDGPILVNGYRFERADAGLVDDDEIGMPNRWVM